MYPVTNYLITGSQGFLGKVLVSNLKENGNHVYTLGRSKDSDFVQDITQPFALSLKTVQSLNVIIHAAGKAHVIPKNEIEKQAFFSVNLEGTKNLCNAISSLPILPQAFIFISTVAVYGRDKGEMIKETHSLNGRTPYAKSKILAEEYLQIWARNNNVNLAILRLPLIAGPNSTGNLNAMIQGIRSGRYLGVGQSKIRKSIVWAEDIAFILPKLAEIGGIYNLTDGQHPSFKELETCISSSFGRSNPKRIPYFMAKVLALLGDFLGRKAPINSQKLKRITTTLTFDDTLASKKLNWKPSPVIQKLPSVLQLKQELIKSKIWEDIDSGKIRFQKKNILISGIHGFVGSNLVSGLKEHPHEIRGISRSTRNLSDLTWEDTACLKKYPFDVIIHLAGLAHDLANSLDESLYLKINRDLTINLYNSFLKSDVETFIYFSSVKAVADQTSGVLKETDVPNPESVYGKSKLQAEEYLQSQPLPPGKRLFIFRPCMIHGPGNKGNLNLLYKFVSKGIPYPLAAFDNRRSFLSIGNLCYIIERVMMDPSIPSGIYNLADDEALSTNEVVKSISKNLNRNPRLLAFPKPLLKVLAQIGDRLHLPLNSQSLKKLTENYVVSNEKIKMALKIDSLPLSSREGLSKTIQNFQN